MKCTLSDLEQAHMFADAAGTLGGGAYLDRETGAFRYLGDTLSGLDDPDAEPEEFHLKKLSLIMLPTSARAPRAGRPRRMR